MDIAALIIAIIALSLGALNFLLALGAGSAISQHEKKRH